jgi:hypothetical protein
MSAQLEYERLQNTYYYSLTSSTGTPRDEIGDFSFTIPPFPQKKHNESQRAIFKLRGCVIADQIVAQQVGQTAYFSLEVSGLNGLNNNYNSTNAGGIVGSMMITSNRFFIPNVYDVGNSLTGPIGAPAVDETIQLSTITGSFDLTNGYDFGCGNPVGQTLSFKVYNDVGAQIGVNAFLNTIVMFSIELIDNE